jgi:hypothetical protein
MSVSTNTAKVGGTHGLTDKKVLLASTLDFANIADIVEMAERLREMLS